MRARVLAGAIAVVVIAGIAALLVVLTAADQPGSHQTIRLVSKSEVEIGGKMIPVGRVLGNIPWSGPDRAGSDDPEPFGVGTNYSAFLVVFPSPETPFGNFVPLFSQFCRGYCVNISVTTRGDKEIQALPVPAATTGVSFFASGRWYHVDRSEVARVGLADFISAGVPTEASGNSILEFAIGHGDTIGQYLDAARKADALGRIWVPAIATDDTRRPAALPPSGKDLGTQ